MNGKWVRTFMILLCFLTMMTLGSVYAQESDEIKIYIDGKQVRSDVAPTIQDDRTMVPLRGVLESLGVEVNYNASTKQVVVKNEETEVLLGIGRKNVMVNGRLTELDTTSVLIDNRTLVPLRFIAESLGYNVSWRASDRSVLIRTSNNQVTQSTTLPTVDSYENLYEIIRYNRELEYYIHDDFAIDVEILREETVMDTDGAEEVQESASAPAAEKSSSDTNVQVEGVDEGDIVKTDGTNIYYINNNKVSIIDKNPTEPKILSDIDINLARGNIDELYIDDDKLIIMGTSYTLYGYPGDVARKLMPDSSTYHTQNTFLLIYDVTDPENPKLIKDMDFQGYLKTSRLVDGNLYMVINNNLDYWLLERTYDDSMNMDSSEKELIDYQITPKYADNIKDEITLIEPIDIRYFPDHIEPNYLMTVGINLATDQLDVDTYLGQAETIYATADDLFLGFTHYAYETKASSLVYEPVYSMHTVLYRFGLDKGAIDYKQKGSVVGSVLNQFSLDYYKDHLRIATTKGSRWTTGEESTNNIYILDDDLSVVGEITGLAEGERIYSTRFSGDRIYMVTFRQVDPFFVIDAADPKNPKVLGDLKIPGFSTYMHILDENHVLGFGKATTVEGDQVQTGGVKISLFDVTDPAKPIEKKNEVIGVAGTYTELESTHKALMISLNKGIMGFPIQVAGTTPYNVNFNGAYIYDITKSNFEFRGLVGEDVDSGKGYQRLRRLLYIGDYLYTVSDNEMKVYTLDDLKYVSSVLLP